MKPLAFLLLLLASAAMSAFSSPAIAACSPEDGNDFDLFGSGLDNQFIVRFRDSSAFASSDAEQARKINLHSSGFGANAQWIRRTANGAGVVRITGKNKSAVAQAMQSLASRGDIEYVVKDHVFTAMMEPNDSLYPQMWALKNTVPGISVANAWNRTPGTGTVIAILDTGITTHPDLNTHGRQGYDFVSTRASAGDGDERDPDASDPGDYRVCPVRTTSSWHGSHVAGIAAATGNNAQGIVGVAYGATILPVRVLGRGGGTLSDIADGIVWAAGGSVPGVPPNPTPATVINLSFGAELECGPVERAAIDYAIRAGVTVVVAAGNANRNSALFSPASCPGVITVAATDSTGKRAGFSNFGSHVEIAAPGVDILSTLNTGTAGPATPTYSLRSGTSMSAPHVAGVVGLMQAAFPRTPRQITSILQRTAKPLTSPCPEGCGSGILNADSAVAAAATWPAPIFSPRRMTTCDSTTTIYQLNNFSTDPDDTVVSAAWDFGDGRTSTTWSPKVTYPNSGAGTRQITLTVTDANGNTSSDSITVDTVIRCLL